MARRAEAVRNGMVLRIQYRGECYEYLFLESTFTNNVTLLEQKRQILEELDEPNLNQAFVLVRGDNTEQVMDDASLMAIYHDIFQEDVYIDIRPLA